MYFYNVINLFLFVLGEEVDDVMKVYVIFFL